MRQVITQTLPAGSGMLLGLIGTAMLTKTEAFLAMSDVRIDPDPSLLSELKAPSLLLILTGVLMLIGSVRSRCADLGLAVGAVVYGSYGMARLAGMVIDGLPTGPLLVATLIELVLAALLMALRISRLSAKQPAAQQPSAA